MGEIIDFETRKVTFDDEMSLQDAFDCIEYLEEKLADQVTKTNILLAIGIELTDKLKEFDE